jgi:hypothetical protein
LLLTAGEAAHYIVHVHPTAAKTSSKAQGGHAMPQRGDILVERLTGKRAMVIHVNGEQLTCRFADGRLEDRFAFELDAALPPLSALLAFLGSLFATATRERPPLPATERPRPQLLVRPTTA